MAVTNFSGLASGIDFNALIDSLSEATRQQRVKPNEKKVTELEETNSALDDLKKKLETLKSKAREFSTIAGGGLTKTGTSSNETMVTASATNAATNGSYVLTPATLAKNGTHSFNDRFAAVSTIINGNINNADPAAPDRTVTYTIGTGAEQETIAIVLTNTTTASEFVTNFNSTATKANAALVNMGTASSPSYAIVINSLYEGTERGQIGVTVGDGITDPNNDTFTTDGAFVTATSSAATNATFTMSGISGTITRSTNNISDVISGVTFNLHGTLTATTITIGDDVTSTTARTQELVDAFNEIASFIAEQNKIERQEDGDKVENVFSPLASTRTDDNILFSLRSAISSSTYEDGVTVAIFADLGITTERDGTLKFDTAVFKSAMAGEPASVGEILKNFADEVSTTGGTIDQFTRFNGLIDVTINGNRDLVTNLNDRISQAEIFIAKQEEQLRGRFARFEALMGKLQSQQSQLTSALAGLGN